MKRTGPTNIHLRLLISYLKKKSRENGANIWRKVAEYLEKPTRNRVEVNIWKINKYTVNGDTVVVPGKVLGSGFLNHKVTVAAWSFSQKSKEKILKAGGNILTIDKLIEINPKGSNIKILV
ncbi:MAG: 50S ribosomal protein L18e [Thermoprotei archaeon]|nr:MAG: 50S ribosomal protein L18e [Thermoprotei archaeon]RLE69636.1 MAG: 50S ribosomal protein L18e [Thermoprotei archaeon]